MKNSAPNRLARRNENFSKVPLEHSNFEFLERLADQKTGQGRLVSAKRGRRFRFIPRTASHSLFRPVCFRFSFPF